MIGDGLSFGDEVLLGDVAAELIEDAAPYWEVRLLIPAPDDVSTLARWSGWLATGDVRTLAVDDERLVCQARAVANGPASIDGRTKLLVFRSVGAPTKEPESER